MANLEEKICVECGEFFMPTRSKCKYCSDECRMDAHRKQVDKNNKRIHEKIKVKPKTKSCAVCKKKFQTNRSDVVTCSPQCQRTRTLEKHKVYNQMRRDEAKEAKKIKEVSKQLTIAEFDRKAREMGMSYGHYELYLRMQARGKRNAV